MQLLELKRENGYIILDQLNLEKYNTNGKREKYLYNNIMFKKIRQNSYEDYSELFNEEVLKLLGISCAFYNLAKYHGNKGVITTFFTHQDKFVSGINIISSVCKTTNINEIMSYNNIEELKEIIRKFLSIRDGNLSSLNQIIEDLRKLFIYDLLMLQSDRNPNNWGLIKEGDEWKLMPIYDNSNTANFNHLDQNPFDVHPLLKNSKTDPDDVYKMIKKNHDIESEIIEMIKIVDDNIEYIIRRIELKTSTAIPEDFREYI